MANYGDNAYNWLKRKGLAAKYEFAGIYCIKIDDEIVYVGKSGNMLRRIAQHYAGIQMGTEKKYRIMAEARRKGHTSALMFCIMPRAADTRTNLRKSERKRANISASIIQFSTRKSQKQRIGKDGKRNQ